MAHYWKLIDKVIRDSDIVLEVVDARMASITRNRKVESKIKQARKPFIIVLNKSDLITEKMRKNIERKLRSTNYVFVSCRARSGFSRLRKMIKSIAGENKKIFIGVVGYPNTGKSSIINSLVGRKKARTSSIAGFTKGIQWVSDSKHLALYDTPGVIPIEENDEIKQALMSVIPPSQIKDPELVAIKIIEIFIKENKSALEKNYRIEANDNPEDVIFSIGKKMNYLMKGGKIDIKRTCIKIINDWQKGKLFLKSDLCRERDI